MKKVYNFILLLVFCSFYCSSLFTMNRDDDLIESMENLQTRLIDLKDMLRGGGGPIHVYPTKAVLNEQNIDDINKAYNKIMPLLNILDNQLIKNYFVNVRPYISSEEPLTGLDLNTFYDIEDRYLTDLDFIDLDDLNQQQKDALKTILVNSRYLRNFKLAQINAIKDNELKKRFLALDKSQREKENEILKALTNDSSTKPEEPTHITHDLVFEPKYLVNNQTYARYVPTSPIPIRMRSGSELQQILALNQFLNPEYYFVTDPTIVLDNGLKMAQYITFLRALNPNLPPQDRDDYQTTIGGGIPSCGYQALRNCTILIEAFNAKNNNEFKTKINELYNIQEANKVFGTPETNKAVGNGNKYGLWRQEILNRRKDQRADLNDGDWIFLPEITYLIKTYFNDFEKNIAVFEDLDDARGNEKLINLKNGLTQPNSIACFILFQPSPDSPNGHWITLVVTTDDASKKTYTIIDSADTPRYPKQFNPTAKQEFFNPLLDYLIPFLEQK